MITLISRNSHLPISIVKWSTRENHARKRLNHYTVGLIALGGTLALTDPLLAESNSGFYRQNTQGWFWYQTLPELEDELSNVNDPSAQPIRSSQTSTMEKPALTAAWFRENMQHYMDKAIDEPTPGNIKAYLYLQRIMMDKSSEFSDMSQQIVMGDPNLDEISRRPLAPFASQAMDKFAREQTELVLKEIANRAGLFFFFRSDCPYCHAQAPVLESFAEQFGMPVLPISLDGQPLASGQFPNFRVDQGQAIALNVHSVPALFLLGPEDNFLPISQGTVSFDELSQRVILAAQQARLISSEAYQRTLPVSAPVNQRNYSELEIIQLKQKSSDELLDYLKEVHFKEKNTPNQDE